MEIWKNIEDLEVSNLGNFRKDGIIFKQYKNRYMYVFIKKKMFLSHRLIAKYWIENPNNKPYINHINGIKYDNRILVLVTKK